MNETVVRCVQPVDVKPQTTETRGMSEARDLKPTVVQQIMRRGQLRKLVFPSPQKLDYFSTHPRAPYAGLPSRAVRRSSTSPATISMVGRSTKRRRSKVVTPGGTCSICTAADTSST
jgi:hypothetical protein